MEDLGFEIESEVTVTRRLEVGRKAEEGCEEGDTQEEVEGFEEGGRQEEAEGCEWKQNCDLSCLARCPPVHQDAGHLRLLLFM